MGSLPSIEELVRQIQDLEHRVAALEHREATPVASAFLPDIEPDTLPSTNGLEDTASLIPVLGRALLGIAGAYLLRALTELSYLPRTAGICAGIAYSVLWLYLAAHTAGQRRLVVAVNGLTSVLVLGPLLWEATEI